MKGLLGLINLYENETHLFPLTKHRPPASIPFAGRYRLIDFALSNLVNAGVITVGVMVRDKYRSLIDHLRSGKDWDLARKKDGLFVLPPAQTANCAATNDLENFLGNLDYIYAASEDFVIICGTKTVCNIPIEQAFHYHLAVGADVTVIGGDFSAGSNGICLNIGDDGRVVGSAPNSEGSVYDIQPLGFYILSKTLMAELIRRYSMQNNVAGLFEGIIRDAATLRVFVFRHNGYAARIDSVEHYFQHHMELLIPAVWQELFFRYGPVFTRVKDEAPSKYKGQASVKNSIIANGCIIEGTVENSILFRSVVVERGAEVRNSILIQNSRIGPDARLNHVLCDKDAWVTAGRCMNGTSAVPYIVEKGMVM